MMSGQGEFHWPDRRIYKGSFVKDKKNGMGTIIYRDGRKEVGYW